MFLTSGKNMFSFRAEKFVFETYTSRAAKQGNICLRNYNVSVTIFPSLAKPDILSFLGHYIILQGHLFIFVFLSSKHNCFSCQTDHVTDADRCPV